MSKKFNLNLSKINSKKVPAVAKIESIYNINYEELDISGIEKEKLIKYENDITFHKEKSIEHIFKYSKAIFEANQIFSNRGNGLFGKWIEKLGIDRDSANVAIRKYSLFLEYQTKGLKKPEKVLELPNRNVKTLSVSIQDHVTNIAHGSGEFISEKIDQVKEAVGVGVNKAKEKAEDIKEEVEEKAEEAKEGTKEKAEDDKEV